MADDGDAPAMSEDDVAAALSAAFDANGIALDDDGVKVTSSGGLFQLKVRLNAWANPVPQAPDDPDGDAAPGSVQAAPLLLLGAVQIVDDSVRVTMRVVVTETSEIKETGEGDASGAAADAITDAAQTAISQLPSLSS